MGSPYPGNAALGAVDDVELTRRVYPVHRRRPGPLRRQPGHGPLRRREHRRRQPRDRHPLVRVGRRAGRPAHPVAAVHGLQSAGVAACVKHFPGHGATRQDSHFDLPVVDASMELLWRRELPPFQAAIAAGVRSIMTAHIRVPVLTGDLPATFSPEALITLLRKDLGFGGAIVSDALEMQGASGAIGVPEAAVRALVAGNDLLCFGGELVKEPDTVALELIEATAAAIVEAVRVGRLTDDRLAEAAARNALLGTTSVSERVNGDGPRPWPRRGSAGVADRGHPACARWPAWSSSNRRPPSRLARFRGDSRRTCPRSLRLLESAG